MKEGYYCIFVSVILIDSVLKIGKNYYPQVFLRKFIYIVKKWVFRYITDDLEILSGASDKTNSDKENKKRLTEYWKNCSKIWKNDLLHK